MRTADYTKRCKNFAQTIAREGLSPVGYYTTSDDTACGWIHTTDNAHGGVDVSWAQGLSEEEIVAQAEAHFYEEFCHNVAESVVKWLPQELKDSRAVVIDVKKNNDITEKALVVNRENINVSPSIYLEPYFEQFKKSESSHFRGNDDFGEILNRLSGVYLKNSLTENMDIRNVMEWEKVRDHLVCRAVNRDMNAGNLLDCPYVDKGDFAITFHIELDLSGTDMENTAASVNVSRQMLLEWNKQVKGGISIHELFDIAKENTMERHPLYMKDMADVMVDMGLVEEMPDELSEEMSGYMFIVSNAQKMSGAVNLFFPEVQDRVRETFGHSVYYALPSSVHEWLLIPRIPGMEQSEEHLNRMIRDVNREQLEPKEVLGERAYILDTKRHLLVDMPSYRKMMEKGMEQAGKEEELSVRSPKF